MTILEAMRARHSVRQYTDKCLDNVTAAQLQHEIDLCNSRFGLHIQLVTDEPEAFSGLLPHFGKFSGVRHYIALVGRKQPQLDELAGYCGERLVIKAQALGMNSCWAALTYSKKKARVQVLPGERLVCVIAIGYGANHGKPHKSRSLESLYQADAPVPHWFLRGMKAVTLAPTAMNQQKFLFTLEGTTVRAVSTGGSWGKVDLGIAKYHFEVGAGTENFHWSNHQKEGF